MKDVKETMRGILWLVGLISAVGVCVYYIVNGTFHPILILVLLICLYPWCEGFWNLFYYECSDNRNKRILKRILPKIGFMIKSIDWDNDAKCYEFCGYYEKEYFEIRAYRSSITVFDAYWYRVEPSEPLLPIYEAANKTNARKSICCVVISEPGKDHTRGVYTTSQIILPEYKPDNFLKNFLIRMLLCKREFMETLEEKRAEESLPNRKIGFAINDKNTYPEGEKVK